jgi:hypothetical protein
VFFLTPHNVWASFFFQRAVIKNSFQKKMALHHDASKPRMELLPSDAMTEWARAMTFGAKKYGDHNWRKGMAWTRVLGSLGRHLTAFMAGQDNDPESGVSHMAHVMCNAAFLIHYSRNLNTFDDRYKVNEEAPAYAPVQTSVQTPCSGCGGDVQRQDPPAIIYRGPQDQFLYTFHSGEYEKSADPFHWTKQWCAHTPVYLFDSAEELEKVWDIYTP